MSADLIAVRVCGIPAAVRIDSYCPGDPGRYTGHPDGRYPSEPAEIEWTVCDRRGRVAPWLARKLDQRERERIERELIAQIERERRESVDDARIEAYRSRYSD
jgi:hypothetical protein